MYVTTAETRGGILVAVVSGGRPKLADRPTHKFLSALSSAGVRDIVWSVSDVDAPGYESDGHELAVYPRQWAVEYAADHWMQSTPPQPDAFLGAFPGREWACREAERRGCWAVLQLDDNIIRLGMMRGTASGRKIIAATGGLGLFVDLFAAVALSTNARTVGAQLYAVVLHRSDWKVARTGFPYSCFLERVGNGREPWFGPFEDDITHSFQYGTRADGVTTALMPILLYDKEPRSKSGMRAHYNNERSVQLQRMFPESARIGVRATHANGRGTPRIFHSMARNAIKNPLVVRDPILFGRAKDRMAELADMWREAEAQSSRDKILRRTGG